MIKKTLFVLLIVFILFLSTNAIYAENYTYSNLTTHMTNGTFSLDNNYEFSKEFDSSLVEGIVVPENITIRGNNYFIDGSNQAKGLYINSNCNVLLENLTLKNCFGKSNGGAIFLGQNSNLTLKNCKFISNKVYNANGGVIYCKGGNNINILNTYFFNNSAIRESNLEWNNYKRGMGSALCVNIDSNVKLIDSNFTNNNAYLSTILIVSYNDVNYNLSTLYVDNCRFNKNSARTNTAIYLDELGKGEILNSVFKDNVASDTGSILLLDAPVYALVENCLFEGNFASCGGAIGIPMFEDKAALNVTVNKCNFTKNKANANGGAIYSYGATLNIVKSNFNDNHAAGYGGAICANRGPIKIIDSNFNSNKADYGGSFSSSNNEVINVDKLNFINNIAFKKGGAIYSNVLNVLCGNCIFKGNSAKMNNDIQGAFRAQVTQISNYFNNVKLKIKLTSPWKQSTSQMVKLRFTGLKSYSTGWIKMSKNGIITFKVPFNINVGKYSLKIAVENGVCYTDQVTINVIKSPCKVQVKKTTAHYNSGKQLKVHIKNAKTKHSVGGAKVILKVFSGKKHHDYTLVSDDNGLVKFDTSKLSVGKHIIKFTSKDKNIRLSKATSSINIIKATAKIASPKIIKKPSKLNVKVKHKSTGKPIKSTRFDVKIYTGNNYKTVKVKTDSNGIFKINTNKLTRGVHKLHIVLMNNNYNINSKFNVRVI